ncbi:hypothetical protein [Streptomyces anulatus]|uniref:hypothetical protein n=1 Tax=Streptomyces anulatus TaxID=1892 RepID=UPI002E0DC7DB|nr:hypothetical protein OG557_01830 [Streptomyces anulatus]
MAALVLCTAPPAVASSPTELCAPQYAAAQAVQARIKTHNAQPHRFTPQQSGAFAAYNAEAKALNTENAKAVAAYTACFQAMMAMLDATGAGSMNLKDLTPTKRTQIDDAKRRLGTGWTAPPPPKPGKNWRVPKSSLARPMYDALRAGNPGNLPYTYLKGGTKLTVGQPDPAYPASSRRVIMPNARGNPKISADHIVPLAELMQMRGFTKLSAENMFIISRAPINFQWLSSAANLSKQSRSAAAMTGVDPKWQASQVTLENETRKKLQDIIDQLLKGQGT